MAIDELASKFWLLVSEYSPTVATVRGEHSFNDSLRSFRDEDLDDLAGRFRGIERDAKNLGISNGALTLPLLRGRVYEDLLG